MQLCERLGVEFPLFAFSHCRDVVAAVSRAGGFGVLGATRLTPETLEEELAWIDAHVDGKPYGADIIFPGKLAVDDAPTPDELQQLIPPHYREFVDQLLSRYGVKFSADRALEEAQRKAILKNSEELLEVALRHPIKLIASALGIAPARMIERSKACGVAVAALVGSKEQALRQAEAGVDVIVAQGTEAGGHCGEVSTLVLVPEIIRALEPRGSVPVLAAGGIVTGRQMAGMMAMGAAGAWTGSVWLATTEAETSEIFRNKMIAATSRDTVRSKARTGKLCRQLRSDWHDAWQGADAPEPLGMPLQSMLAIPALDCAERAAEAGNARAVDLVSYYVGQGVGMIENVRSARAVVQEFREDFVGAFERLGESLAG